MMSASPGSLLEILQCRHTNYESTFYQNPLFICMCMNICKALVWTNSKLFPGASHIEIQGSGRIEKGKCLLGKTTNSVCHRNPDQCYFASPSMPWGISLEEYVSLEHSFTNHTLNANSCFYYSITKPRWNQLWWFYFPVWLVCSSFVHDSRRINTLENSLLYFHNVSGLRLVSLKCACFLTILFWFSSTLFK